MCYAVLGTYSPCPTVIWHLLVNFHLSLTPLPVSRNYNPVFGLTVFSFQCEGEHEVFVFLWLILLT